MMAENKRFYRDFSEKYGTSIRDKSNDDKPVFIFSVHDSEDLCDIFNEFADENEQLKQENKKLQGEYDHLLWLYNGLGCEYDGLKYENEQLKQRNNRQYEQLSRLYNLIEQKEWRVLTDIIDDFKKSDEQLQKEWRTYGDVE